MVKKTLLIALSGILVLLLLPFILPPKLVNSPADLNKLINNQKITSWGKVIEEKTTGEEKTLRLSNGLLIKLEKIKPDLKNKELRIEAKYTKTQYGYRLEATLIKIKTQ